jgi:hypothetical protein
MRKELDSLSNRDVPLFKRTLRVMTGVEIETDEELPGAGREFSEQFESLADRLDEVETQLTALSDLSS